MGEEKAGKEIGGRRHDYGKKASRPAVEHPERASRIVPPLVLV